MHKKILFFIKFVIVAQMKLILYSLYDVHMNLELELLVLCLT